jgi:hypothetical protein
MLPGVSFANGFANGRRENGVLARVMVDMLAPVGVFQFGDAGPVAGRQWFR